MKGDKAGQRKLSIQSLFLSISINKHVSLIILSWCRSYGLRDWKPDNWSKISNVNNGRYERTQRHGIDDFREQWNSRC